MSEEIHDDDNHFGPDCPQCQAMMAQTMAMGAMAEAMQKMLDDGVFYRMGQELARRREEAFWKAFLGK